MALDKALIGLCFSCFSASPQGQFAQIPATDKKSVSFSA
jgi:hypothetical protein